MAGLFHFIVFFLKVRLAIHFLIFSLHHPVFGLFLLAFIAVVMCGVWYVRSNPDD